jgi:hypothetical protein
MTRCRQAAALLDAVFAGTDLTRAQAEHVRDCAECARAMSQARRFENELGRTATALTPESMPAAMELVELAETTDGGRRMTWGRGLLAGAIGAVLLLAVVVGGSRWLPSVFEALQPGVSADDLDAWVDHALAGVADEGPGGGSDAWEPAQVEVCGESAIAILAESEPGSSEGYRWFLGEPSATDSVGASGQARTISDAEVATLRAQLPVCEVLVDARLDEAAAFTALSQARDLHSVTTGAPQPVTGIADVRAFEVMDFKPTDPEHYVALLQRPQSHQLDRLTLSVGDDGTFAFRDWMFNDVEEQPYTLYRDSLFAPSMYYALLPDEHVAAVDIIGPHTHLRYSAAAPGFVLQAEIPDDAVTEYRFLDADGRVIASGDIVVWPPVQAPASE